jgi:hypothetical protein
MKLNVLWLGLDAALKATCKFKNNFLSRVCDLVFFQIIVVDFMIVH